MAGERRGSAAVERKKTRGEPWRRRRRPVQGCDVAEVVKEPGRELCDNVIIENPVAPWRGEGAGEAVTSVACPVRDTLLKRRDGDVQL